MDKADLISDISRTTGLSMEDSEAALTVFANVVEKELKDGDKIQFVRFENYFDGEGES